MKVIIAGSRSVEDESIVREAVHDAPHAPFHGELVTGGADGVDSIAEHWLTSYEHVDHTVFEADWDTFGAGGGPQRNEKMADYADALIAIWDGESNGTRDMIERALNHGLDTYVVVHDE
jgi:hypothetical protein